MMSILARIFGKTLAAEHLPSPRMTLADFAIEHKLPMSIEPFGAGYLARFSRSMIREVGLLTEAAGLGSTEAEAVADYTQRISRKTLVIDPTSAQPRVIEVPRLRVERSSIRDVVAV